MTWWTWLVLAMLVAAVGAITGMKPKGTRPVARTRLMTIARIVLIAIILLFIYFAWASRAG